jgi:glycerol-3-phosphate dehydrogenase (NAD(P)+)
MSKLKHISIIGAGAWGTALGLAAYRAGLSVTLWSPDPEKAASINQRRENTFRLPGVPLASSIQAISDPQETAKADAVILVPPAQSMRSICERFHQVWPPSLPLLLASKGIENGSMLLMSEVVREYFPHNPLLILSGPSFAHEVAKDLPTALSCAAEDIHLAHVMAEALSSAHFRLYASDDLVGTQIGGACKNVIAIACGIIEGLRFGENARAALVTRGLAEITRLGCQMGAQYETFLGLSGVGDMVLTALSPQSRNHAFGFSLGQGVPLEDLLSNKKTLVEGVHTANAAVALAQKYDVDMPITFAVHQIINGNETIEGVVTQLLGRPLKKERS